MLSTEITTYPVLPPRNVWRYSLCAMICMTVIGGEHKVQLGRCVLPWVIGMIWYHRYDRIRPVKERFAPWNVGSRCRMSRTQPRVARHSCYHRIVSVKDRCAHWKVAIRLNELSSLQDLPIFHCTKTFNEPYLRSHKARHGMKSRCSTIQGAVQCNASTTSLFDDSS